MKRLTKDKTETNVDALLNFAFVKDGEAVLRYADHEENIKLAEYIRKLANAEGCECSREDIIDGGLCSSAECDCSVAVLNTVAIQAAELRARLKAIEDILGDEYDLERLKQLLDGKEKPCGDCPAVFAVKSLAHADLQPVVRCKDCVHRHSRPRCAGRPMDWYCPEGVRRQRND